MVIVAEGSPGGSICFLVMWCLRVRMMAYISERESLGVGPRRYKTRGGVCSRQKLLVVPYQAASGLRVVYLVVGSGVAKAHDSVE